MHLHQEALTARPVKAATPTLSGVVWGAGRGGVRRGTPRNVREAEGDGGPQGP